MMVFGIARSLALAPLSRVLAGSLTADFPRSAHDFVESQTPVAPASLRPQTPAVLRLRLASLLRAPRHPALAAFA